MLLELAEGQLDLAIAPAGLRLPTGVAAESIGALQWRCFGRRGHPAFGRWGRRWAWAPGRPHVVVRVGDQLESPVNIAAGAAGLEPHHRGLAAQLLGGGAGAGGLDLLATLPAPAMAGTLGPHRLESRRVPFAIAPLPHVLLWSSVRAGDPEVAWLAPPARARSAKTRFADGTRPDDWC